MWSNPYTFAFLASLCFGLVIFPWRGTIQTLGPAGLFLFTGGAYVLTGVAYWYFKGFTTAPTPKALGFACLTAIIYVAALVFCSFALGHPTVNVPIAVAITAAYPLFTAAISIVLLGQRFTPREAVFFTMALVGVVGLGLFSRR